MNISMAKALRQSIEFKEISHACIKSMHYEKRTIEKLRDSPLLISCEYILGEKPKIPKKKMRKKFENLFTYLCCHFLQYFTSSSSGAGFCMPAIAMEPTHMFHGLPFFFFFFPLGK